MKAPPGKDACLMMAKITYTRNQELSWKWLLAWGFYEMYVDGWHSEHETLFDYLGSEITALKEALSQSEQKQEPVGYVYSESGVKSAAIQRDLPNGTPLFITHPPQRKPLSFNEITAIEEKVYMRTTHKGKPAFEYANALIRATEAAHGIKENT